MTLDILEQIDKTSKIKYCSECIECFKCGEEDCNCDYCRDEEWCGRMPNLPLLTYSKQNYKQLCLQYLNKTQIIIKNLKPIIQEYY